MPITVNCKCGKSLTLRDDSAGNIEHCPYCSRQFRVPSPKQVPPAVASPAPMPPRVPFPAPAVQSQQATADKLWQYKVLTQKDKWFSGKFDPAQLEAAMNAYAKEGGACWRSQRRACPGSAETATN